MLSQSHPKAPENERTIRAFQSGQRGEWAGWSGVRRAAEAIKTLRLT